MMLEVCCRPDSKLGDVSRKTASGCMVIRVTKDDDVLNPETRKRIVRQVLTLLRELPSGRRRLVWASLPCTGGASWIHVNKTIPSATTKVEEHQRGSRKLWNALVDLVNSLRSRPFVATLNGQSNCVYWKLDYALSFCQRRSMNQVTFDAGLVLLVDVHDTPIKEPWKIRSNLDSLIESFVNL